MNVVRLNNFELRNDIASEVLQHPGMISRQERQLLVTLVLDHYDGRGKIIDAGVFLGASTVCFDYALNVRGFPIREDKPVISFERAIVRPNFDRHASKAGLPSPAVGESFAEILRGLLKPTERYAALQLGDILEYQYDSSDAIEIAFLDILKNEAVCRHCFEQFLPPLVVGGFIIQQDYFFDQLPFIKYMNEAFSDSLEYVGEVRSSALFRLTKPLSLGDVTRTLDSLTDDDKIRLHKQAAQRAASDARRYLMHLSLTRLFGELRRLDEAEATLRQAQAEFATTILDKNGDVREEFAWRHERLESFLARIRIELGRDS